MADARFKRPDGVPEAFWSALVEMDICDDGCLLRMRFRELPVRPFPRIPDLRKGFLVIADHVHLFGGSVGRLTVGSYRMLAGRCDVVPSAGDYRQLIPWWQQALRLVEIRFDHERTGDGRRLFRELASELRAELHILESC